MIIQVTQEDIDKGAPCNSRCCPVALAIKRMPGIVSGTNVYVTKSGIVIGLDRYPLPESVHWFMIAFDSVELHKVLPDSYNAVGVARPFEFELGDTVGVCPSCGEPHKPPACG